jgi:ABC-type lipoprotein release transport system permease subunit
VNSFLTKLRVSWFIAWRQLKRGSMWTNVLIVFIMTLTFLNLIAVGGILVGLIEGSSRAYRAQYSGDVLIRNVSGKDSISQSPHVESLVRNTPGVDVFSVRELRGVKVESDYQRKGITDKGDFVNTVLAGIDPETENSLTTIRDFVIDGSFLEAGQEGFVVIGSDIVKGYARGIPREDEVIGNVYPGSKVRIEYKGKFYEKTVKGIIRSKNEGMGRRMYMNASELRKITDNSARDSNEIAIRLLPGYTPEQVRDYLVGVIPPTANAQVETWEESQGSFFRDINMTFALLGNFIGAIGLFIASITIFIVIFINAVNRRRYIGILKGIGIPADVIEIAYVIQACIYALIGTACGMAIVFFVLIPYFDANPINFPFSDGILYATLSGALIRAGALMIVTLLAGYIPAKIVTSKKTLDAILGR